jgi:GNAT superfamily N-acetyltransferase
MFQTKVKLERREKRLLKNLHSWGIYKSFIAFLCAIFAFRKVFFIHKKPKMKGFLWMASITYYKVFWTKIGYLDDFIVHKKYRWKGVGKSILWGLHKKIDEEKTDYMLLLSRSDRLKSHQMYKKFWFTILSVWIGIIAYKKFIRKK